MPTYNRQQYVAEAIQSVLDQTFTEFELIVINDGSTDCTEKIITKFNDDRLICLNQDNHGISHASNTGILHSRGKYIAFFADDDICYPNRLERQYEYLLETGCKVVFSWATLIGDDGEELLQFHQDLQDNFRSRNRTQSEMLNHFFFKGNYLCAPSCMVEREALFTTDLACITLLQLSDFALWINLLKKYDLHVLPEELIKFRIHPNQGNTSSLNRAVRIKFVTLIQ
jgi:glycosyltransferase involved in cell wall biosynthesis